MKTKYKKMPVGYGMVQTAVMQLQGLSIQAKAVYSLLASYTGSKDFCFPTLQTMCKDLNYSIKSKDKIVKYLNELEKIGLLERSKLFPDDKMKNHNKYRLMYIEEEPRGCHTAPSKVAIQQTRRDPYGKLGECRKANKNNNIINNIIINKGKAQKNLVNDEIINQKPLYLNDHPASGSPWPMIKESLSKKISDGSLNTIDNAFLEENNGTFVFSELLPDYLKELLRQSCEGNISFQT